MIKKISNNQIVSSSLKVLFALIFVIIIIPPAYADKKTDHLLTNGRNLKCTAQAKKKFYNCRIKISERDLYFLKKNTHLNTVVIVSNKKPIFVSSSLKVNRIMAGEVYLHAKGKWTTKTKYSGLPIVKLKFINFNKSKLTNRRKNSSSSRTLTVLIGLVVLILVILFFLRINRQKPVSAQAAVQKKTYVPGKIRIRSFPKNITPKINPLKCTGCKACVEHCPETNVFEIEDNKAIVKNPDKCLGHATCVAVCEDDAIELFLGNKLPRPSQPMMTPNYEDIKYSGLYYGGEIIGMSSMANAMSQGAKAVQNAVASLSLPQRPDIDYQMVIIGAGPAGLAMACQAQEIGISYLCIEREAPSLNIAHHPRASMVSKAQWNIPGFGQTELQKPELSKENVAKLFSRIEESLKLKIQYETELEQIEINSGVFTVQTSAGVIKTEKLMLAFGIGGQIVRVGAAGEKQSKVSYRLCNEHGWTSKRILVVGNQEQSAQAVFELAQEQMDNQITYMLDSTNNLSNETERRIISMDESNRITLVKNMRLEKITVNHVYLNSENRGEKRIPNDRVLIIDGEFSVDDFFDGLKIKRNSKFVQGEYGIANAKFTIQ